MKKPDTVPQKMWDEMSVVQRRAIIRHEHLHKRLSKPKEKV